MTIKSQYEMLLNQTDQNKSEDEYGALATKYYNNSAKLGKSIQTVRI